MERESVVSKLQKLIAHERSARDIGNIAEAEAFAAKIQTMLTSHKLEMSEVEIQEREAKEPIDDTAFWPTEAGWRRTACRVAWQERLATAIATANGCELLVTPRSNWLAFVGRGSDRETAKALFLYFLEMAKSLADRAAHENRDSERTKCFSVRGRFWRNYISAWMRDYRESYAMGFTGAVAIRIIRRHREMIETERCERGESSTGLVLIKRDAMAVQSFIAELTKDHKPWTEKEKNNYRKGANHLNGDAFQHGKDHGERVALTSNRLSAQEA